MGILGDASPARGAPLATVQRNPICDPPPALGHRYPPLCQGKRVFPNPPSPITPSLYQSPGTQLPLHPASFPVFWDTPPRPPPGAADASCWPCRGAAWHCHHRGGTPHANPALANPAPQNDCWLGGASG